MAEPHPPEPIARNWLPDAALLLTLLIWASTFLVTKAVFTYISVFAYISVRFALMTALAFVVLWITVRRTPGQRWVPHRADWSRFIAVGLIGFTLNGLGFNIGVDLTSVFSAAFPNATAPLFTILFLAAIGEQPPLAAWIGVVVATAGVGIFLIDQAGEHSLSGDLLCYMAAVAFGLYSVVNRPWASRYPPATYTAWTLLFGAIPLVLAGAPAASRQDWGGLGAESWFAIVYVVIFPVYIAYMLWNFGIARRGAAIATSFGLLVPIMAGILSAILYDESFGPTKLVGAALVLGGLLFIRLAGNLRLAKPRT